MTIRASQSWTPWRICSKRSVGIAPSGPGASRFCVEKSMPSCAQTDSGYRLFRVFRPLPTSHRPEVRPDAADPGAVGQQHDLHGESLLRQ